MPAGCVAAAPSLLAALVSEQNLLYVSVTRCICAVLAHVQLLPSCGFVD
jgi:hypothetical protein